MLDVHPPHAAAHTWKDFFIHIATITIGLLIAVALEQGVEHLHNRHLRRELQAQLQEDARHNLAEGERWDTATDSVRTWLRQRADQVFASLHGEARPDPAQPVAGIADLPVDSAWDAAKASGAISVLSADDIKTMSECDGVLKNFVASGPEFASAYGKLAEFEWTIAGPGKRIAALTPLSPAQKQDYLKLLLTSVRALGMLRAEGRSFRGCLTAFTHGERDLNKVYDAERQSKAQP